MFDIHVGIAPIQSARRPKLRLAQVLGHARRAVLARLLRLVHRELLHLGVQGRALHLSLPRVLDGRHRAQRLEGTSSGAPLRSASWTNASLVAGKRPGELLHHLSIARHELSPPVRATFQIVSARAAPGSTAVTELREHHAVHQVRRDQARLPRRPVVRR